MTVGIEKAIANTGDIHHISSFQGLGLMNH